MTITTEAGIIAGLRPGIPFTKTIAATIFNGGPIGLGLIGTGYPATFTAATPGLAGANVDGTSSTLGGTFPFVNPSSGGTDLARVQLLTNAASFYVGIFDLLWYNTGIAVATTTAQTVGSGTQPARDATGTTNGAGVTAWLYNSVATTNVSAVTNTTITYTNSAGTGSKTGTIGLAGWPAAAVAGNFVPFTLAVGDSGIRSIQSITLGTSLVTGTVNLMLIRHIASIAVPSASSGWMADWATIGYPPLFNGTALSFYAIQSTAAGVSISGQLAFAQG